jgi:hypothetical protein
MLKILLSMVNILCEVPLYNFLVVRIRKRFFTWSVATHGHYTSIYQKPKSATVLFQFGIVLFSLKTMQNPHFWVSLLAF